MSNQNREYGKRKELNVQSLACTFTLPNIDAYFRVNDDEDNLFLEWIVKDGYLEEIILSGS